MCCVDNKCYLNTCDETVNSSWGNKMLIDGFYRYFCSSDHKKSFMTSFCEKCKSTNNITIIEPLNEYHDDYALCYECLTSVAENQILPCNKCRLPKKLIITKIAELNALCQNCYNVAKYNKNKKEYRDALETLKRLECEMSFGDVEEILKELYDDEMEICINNWHDIYCTI